VTEMFTIELKPERMIRFCGSKARSAILDFGGDAITYSGDLPVDEAAWIFFQHVFMQLKRESDEQEAFRKL
jgi:hypothetical protein